MHSRVCGPCLQQFASAAEEWMIKYSAHKTYLHALQLNILALVASLRTPSNIWRMLELRLKVAFPTRPGTHGETDHTSNHVDGHAAWNRSMFAENHCLLTPASWPALCLPQFFAYEPLLLMCAMALSWDLQWPQWSFIAASSNTVVECTDVRFHPQPQLKIIQANHLNHPGLNFLASLSQIKVMTSLFSNLPKKNRISSWGFMPFRSTDGVLSQPLAPLKEGQTFLTTLSVPQLPIQLRSRRNLRNQLLSIKTLRARLIGW
mmetsp:Transcript_60272/g.160438  ORF Transcript_60272/g.160438 Transcript_60272/m.160438 type:complete len:261 (+) Transcript_60272:249-1031(+)